MDRMLTDIEKQAFIKAYAVYIESILNISPVNLSIFDLLPESIKEIHNYVIFDKQCLLEECKSLKARVLNECGFSMQEYDQKLLEKRIYQKCYYYIMPALLHIRIPK